MQAHLLTYAHTYVCTHACLYMCMITPCMHVCMHMLMYVHMYAHMHVCRYVCTHTFMHAHTHVCMHMHVCVKITSFHFIGNYMGRLCVYCHIVSIYIIRNDLHMKYNQTVGIWFISCILWSTLPPLS